MAATDLYSSDAVPAHIVAPAAALAAYLSCAEVCEASYKRSVLPVWPLARP